MEGRDLVVKAAVSYFSDPGLEPHCYWLIVSYVKNLEQIFFKICNASTIPAAHCLALLNGYQLCWGQAERSTASIRAVAA